jgi:hypothetical protein
LTAAKLWRAAVWRGRAGQVLELAEPGAADGTTANSLAADHHGPQQDGQAGRSKFLTRNCLRILVQGLGPSRARCLRNRPLAQPRTGQGSRKGGLDIPGRWRPRPLTSHEAPDSDVDAPPLAWHWLGDRSSPSDHHRCLLTKMGHSWFIGGSNRALASTPTPLGIAGRFRKPQVHCSTRATVLDGGVPAISNDRCASP